MGRLNAANFYEDFQRAEVAPGSEAHKVFGEKVAKIRTEVLSSRGEVSYLQFMSGLTSFFDDMFENQTSMPPEIATSMLRVMVPYAVGSAMWADTGFPTITLTHDFQRSIAVTDFGDASDEQIRLPFESFVVRLPESLRGKPVMCPMFVYPVPISRPTGLDFHSYRMTLSPEPGEDDRQAFTQWDKEMTFHDFLNSPVRSMEELDAIEAHVTGRLGTTIDPADTERARRILANTLLYVYANGGLPTAKQTGGSFPVEREHSVAPRFRVGRPIKLGPQVKEAIRVGLTGGATWKLMSRFVVRGHFRNQAHGSGLSLRTRRFIEPFWKGPDNITDALERTFEVR